MLFHVRMDVRIPHDLDPETRAEIVAREKDYSQEQQRAGKWPHIWRIVGEYSNFSIFDVESNDELHVRLHGHPRDPAGDASLRRQGLERGREQRRGGESLN